MASKEILALEGALEKLLPSGSDSLELEGVLEQLDSLQSVSRQIIDHFDDVSMSIDGIRLTIPVIWPSEKLI